MRCGRWASMILVVGLGWTLGACRAPLAAEELTATLPAGKVASTVLAPSGTPSGAPAETIEATLEEPLTPTPPLPTPASAPIAHLAGGQALSLEWIHMVNLTAGWAIGGMPDQEPHFLRTSDGGLHWMDVTPPETADPVDGPRRGALAYTIDAQRAWVVYSGVMHPTAGLIPAVVWRTVDGGTTWLPSALIEPPGGSGWFEPSVLGFLDDGFGWLMAAVDAGMMHQYIAIYTTRDGGAHWLRVVDPYGDQPVQSCPKTGLEFADALHGWLTRDCGGLIDQVTIEMTGDGGTTWASRPVPAPAALPSGFTYPYLCRPHSIRLTSASAGSVAVSCRQYLETPTPGGDTLADGPHALYRTQDGGATWDVREYPGGDVLWLDDARGWALGRRVYRTESGGASWELVHEVNWDGQFTFVDTLNGWAVARDGEEVALVRTSNGGASWSLLKPVTAP